MRKHITSGRERARAAGYEQGALDSGRDGNGADSAGRGGIADSDVCGAARRQSGVRPRNILTMNMSLNSQPFAKTAGTVQGVEAAAMTCCLPVEGGFGWPFSIVGQPPKATRWRQGGGGPFGQRRQTTVYCRRQP
jgi:hypothetical protein